MKHQKGHYHAYTEYSLVSWRHYWSLLVSVIECKLRRGKSLTVHIPYSQGLLKRNIQFIEYGEHLKRAFKIKLYWENAPWLNKGTWNLKYPTDYTPFWGIHCHLDLCLDTGHLMLGMRNKGQARYFIRKMIRDWGKQIKHLHLHENDLVYDYHWHTHKILTPKLVTKITKGRTFIYEK